MKNIFNLIAVCVVCILFFTGCKSENERIAIEYAREKDLTAIENAVFMNTDNSYVTLFYVKNFNDNPIDTLYTWEAYEKNEVAEALDKYENDQILVDSLSDLKLHLRETFNEIYNSEEIDKKISAAKLQMYDDSLAWINTVYEREQLKLEKSIIAYGYSFDEVFHVMNEDEETVETIHKIIYIMDNGEVYSCVLNFN